MSTDVYFPYSVPLKSLGRPANFDFVEPEVLIECPPDAYRRAKHTAADPYETTISNVPLLSETGTNTDPTPTAEKGQNHAEGGWPTSVDVSEPEERNKYARRQCRDERHAEALLRVVPQMSAFLRLNGALDIYESIFDDNGGGSRKGTAAAKAAAAAEARSRLLCPWRYGADASTTGGDDTITKTAGPSSSSHLSSVDGPLRVPQTPQSSLSQQQQPTARAMADIAYSDPSVVHALHVSCKLSIPALDGEPHGLHGNSASMGRYTCGSDSARVVVGYCEAFLPARADAARYVGLGAGAGDFFFGAASARFSHGSPSQSHPHQSILGRSSISAAGGTPLFDGTFGAGRLGPLGATGGASGTFLTVGGGPSPASARRSTAVSPLFRSSADSSSRKPSNDDRPAEDRLLDDDHDASMRDGYVHLGGGGSFGRRDDGEAEAEKEADEEARRRELERGDGAAAASATPPPEIRVDGASAANNGDANAHQHNTHATSSTAQLRRNIGSLLTNGGAISGAHTYSLAPLNPIPASEWACAGAMWLTTDPSSHTHLFLSCSGGATAIAASHRDPNIVFGGMGRGVVETWDVRSGPRPVAASGRDGSHRDAVTCVKLVTTKAHEAFTCGLDGQVLFWDTRRLSAGPVVEESVQLRCPQTGTRFAATGIDFDPLVGGTLKYLVSTMEGKVLSCGRRANRSGEKVLGVVSATYGACFGAARCPAVPKVFAACGDWGFKLFGDELKSSAIYSSPMVSSHVLCGAWLPARPSVYMVGTSAGDVYFHDVCRTAHGPVMKVRASSSGVCYLEPHVSGRTVAATDVNGEVHIIALPAVLCEPAADERQLLVAAMEREYARERVSGGVEHAAAAAGRFLSAGAPIMLPSSSAAHHQSPHPPIAAAGDDSAGVHLSLQQSPSVLTMTPDPYATTVANNNNNNTLSDASPSHSPARGLTAADSLPSAARALHFGGGGATAAHPNAAQQQHAAPPNAPAGTSSLLVGLVMERDAEAERLRRRQQRRERRRGGAGGAFSGEYGGWGNSGRAAADAENRFSAPFGGIVEDDDDDDNDDNFGFGGGSSEDEQHGFSGEAVAAGSSIGATTAPPPNLAGAYLALVGVAATNNPYAPPTASVTAGTGGKKAGAASSSSPRPRSASNVPMEGGGKSASAAAYKTSDDAADAHSSPSRGRPASAPVVAADGATTSGGPPAAAAAAEGRLFARLKTAAALSAPAKSANGSASNALAKSAAAKSSQSVVAEGSPTRPAKGVLGSPNPFLRTAAPLQQQQRASATDKAPQIEVPSSARRPTSLAAAAGIDNDDGPSGGLSAESATTDASAAHRRQRERRGTTVGQRPSISGEVKS